MRYSLVIYNNTNVYDIVGFSKRSNIPNLNENSLEDITTFTNSFKNELELWDFLVYNGLIGPQINNDNKLGIALYRSKKSKPSILPYGLSYKEDKKFFNVEFLKSYFSNRVRNIDFMQYFISKYYEKLKDVNPFASSLKYLNDAYTYYLNSHILPLETVDEMREFVKTYTLKKDKNGNYLITFTRVRELAMFAINYERIYLRNRNTNLNINYKEDLDLELQHYYALLDTTLDNTERMTYENKIKELEQKRKDYTYERNR